MAPRGVGNGGTYGGGGGGGSGFDGLRPAWNSSSPWHGVVGATALYMKHDIAAAAAVRLEAELPSPRQDTHISQRSVTPHSAQHSAGAVTVLDPGIRCSVSCQQ